MNSVASKHLSKFYSVIPALSGSLHKGKCGTIGVIGGCKEYTGAPYFSAISSLLVGCDLSHVVCAESAAIPIKSYSPELIVHPLLDDVNLERISYWLGKFDAIAIGPGLGHDYNKIIENIILHCRAKDKPLVIDADAIHVVASNPDIIRNYTNAILTPNQHEFKSMVKKILNKSLPETLEESQSNFEVICNHLKEMSQSLGNVTILRKGAFDLITDGTETIRVDKFGCDRRCGGQGDVLTGILATFSAWIANSNIESKNQLIPSIAACELVRECANQSFLKHGRATIASNLISEIGPSFQKLFEN